MVSLWLVRWLSQDHLGPHFNPFSAPILVTCQLPPTGQLSTIIWQLATGAWRRTRASTETHEASQMHFFELLVMLRPKAAYYTWRKESSAIFRIHGLTEIDRAERELLTTIKPCTRLLEADVLHTAEPVLLQTFIAQQTILTAASHPACLSASETSSISETLECSMSVPDPSLQWLPNEKVHTQSQFWLCTIFPQKCTRSFLPGAEMPYCRRYLIFSLCICYYWMSPKFEGLLAKKVRGCSCEKFILTFTFPF